jgi:hypothetical protein
MKKILMLGIVATLLATPNMADAQVKLPPASSTQTITQSLGITSVSLTYQRPNMNGRKVFGNLVPLNEPWRTGANNIPVLTTEGTITIGGHELPAGTYGLITIPRENEWTIIVSKNAKQWGTYTYKQEEDLFRFNVSVQNLHTPVETFTMQFVDVSTKQAKLNMAWENMQVSIPVSFDQDREIMASIDAAMKGEGNKPYFQAAQYYFNNNKDINKAVEWVNEASKANPQAVHIYYWKSRILLKAGDKAGAIATAKEGLQRATQAGNHEYIKLHNQVLAEAQK